MIPDLGKYASTVLAAYGVTAILLGGLVLVSILRASKVRAALAKFEREVKGGQDGKP